MKGVGKLLNQNRKILFVSWIELLPINHHTGGFRIGQDGEDMTNEIFLPFRRTVCHVFHCFRLPGVADKIRQERHERHAPILRQLGNANIGVDL